MGRLGGGSPEEVFGEHFVGDFDFDGFGSFGRGRPFIDLYHIMIQ